MRAELTYPELVLPRLRYQYCPMCTTPLARAVINDDGLMRVLCPACGWVHYPTHVSGVCMVIQHPAGIAALLPPGESPQTPAALPAGHCEYGESPDSAVIREAYEETGLVVEIEHSLGWHFEARTDYPGPNLLFMYIVRTVGGAPRQSEEGPVAFFPIDQFPAISPSHHGSLRTMQAYRQWLSQQNR